MRARLHRAIGPLLAASVLLPRASAAFAEGAGDAFPVAEQAALFAGAARSTPAFPARAEVWTNGLRRSTTAVVPQTDRSVGLRLPPGPLTGVALGWELRRPDEPASVSHSDLTWRYDLEGRSLGLDGLTWTVRAGGRVGVLEKGASQTLATDLRFALPEVLAGSTAQLRVAPEVSFDAIPGTTMLAVGPELASQTLLPSPAASLKSALNLSVGYRFVSDAKPGLTARVAWTLTPVL